jgi:hypothetical protein
MVELALRGRGVLVVEGEYLIAMMLRDHLEAAGLIVIGPVSSVADSSFMRDPQGDRCNSRKASNDGGRWTKT